MVIFTDDFFPRLASLAVSACLVVESVVHLESTLRATPDTFWQFLSFHISSLLQSSPLRDNLFSLICETFVFGNKLRLHLFHHFLALPQHSFKLADFVPCRLVVFFLTLQPCFHLLPSLFGLFKQVLKLFVIISCLIDTLFLTDGLSNTL